MNDQAYYWTPEWQAAEREAIADIAAGRVRTFATAAEATRWLVETPIDDEGAPDVPNDPIPEPNDGDGEAAPGTEPTEEGKA